VFDFVVFSAATEIIGRGHSLYWLDARLGFIFSAGSSSFGKPLMMFGSTTAIAHSGSRLSSCSQGQLPQTDSKPRWVLSQYVQGRLIASCTNRCSVGQQPVAERIEIVIKGVKGYAGFLIDFDLSSLSKFNTVAICTLSKDEVCHSLLNRKMVV